MKKFILLLATILLANSCNKNGISFEKIKEINGIYYKINERLPYTGKAIEYYKNKKLKLQITYKDGTIVSEKIYDNEGKAKTEKLFNEKGELEDIISYGDGISFEKIKEINGICYKINENKPYTGKVVEYYENNKLKIEKIYKDGKIEFETNYDDEGKTKTEKLFNKDNKVKLKKFYINNNLQEKRKYLYKETIGYLYIEQIIISGESQKNVKIYGENGQVLYDYKDRIGKKLPKIKIVSHVNFVNADKTFKLNLSSPLVDISKYKIEGFLDSSKNRIRIINSFFNPKMNVIEEWYEDFKIKSIDKNHIITETNENREYFDLDWDNNKFYYMDKEGIIPTY